MTDEQVERAKRAPSNFVVLVEHNESDFNEELETELRNHPDTTVDHVLYGILSEGHKDSQTARAWLKKNLTALVKDHGEGTVFRIANMQPAVTAEIKVVSKLTIR